MICCSYNSKRITRNIDRPVNIDTTFILWNKATFSSLKNSIQRVNDNAQKRNYENRLLAFQAFIEVENDNKINPQSIRYKFLDELLTRNNNKSRFYIIEATRSGEETKIINYVIYLRDKNMVSVEIYNFVNERWIKNAKSVNIDLPFPENLNTCIVTFGKGINQDDVIISEFINGTVRNSIFFLYATLSDTGCLKEILSLK